jgi:hypothetical protein
MQLGTRPPANGNRHSFLACKDQGGEGTQRTSIYQEVRERQQTLGHLQRDPGLAGGHG